MKRLVLHLGLPKTGSSSLQWLLAQNRDCLEDAGILYPGPHDLFEKNGNLTDESKYRRLYYRDANNQSHENLNWELGRRERDSQKLRQNGYSIEKLESALRHAPHETIVISAESLADLPHSEVHFDRFKSVARDIDFKVDVVMFIRPQHLWLNSKYSQRVKRLYMATQFTEFVDHTVSRPQKTYREKLTAWNNFRNAELVALPFTRNRLGPNLAATFLSAIGRADAIDHCSFEAHAQAKNESPGPMVIACCLSAARYLEKNSQLERMNSEERKWISHSLIKRGVELGWNEEKFCGLTNEIRDRIREHFERENEKFAREFWGDCWDTVFREDYAQNYVSNEILLDDCTADIRDCIGDVVEKTMRGRRRRKSVSVVKKSRAVHSLRWLIKKARYALHKRGL